MTDKTIGEVRAGVIQELLGSEPRTLSSGKLREHAKQMLSQVHAFEMSIQKIQSAQPKTFFLKNRKT